MAAKDFSDVVLEATKDQEKEEKPSSFSERLKKIRHNRSTRRNKSGTALPSALEEESAPSPLLGLSRSLGTLPGLSLPSIPPLTLPTVEEASPKHELTHRDSFGIYLMNGKEDKQNEEEKDGEGKEKESAETKKTSPEVSMKDGQLVSIVDGHLYEIPEPLPLKQEPETSPPPPRPATPKKTPSPSPPPPSPPPLSPDDTLGPPPSLPSSPPPTLPSSPPPPIPLSLDEDISQSLSPNIYPGDVQFTASDDVFIEGTFPLSSTETPNTETPPTGRESPEESYEEDATRRRSIMSTTSAQDLHFKPSLKKWGVVNLNELNGTSPSSFDDGKDGEYFKSLGPAPGYHNRSYSGLSRVSGGGVEMSLESITELTDPSLPPQLIQDKLTSNNLKEGDIDVKEVAKASWKAKKPPTIEPVIKKEDEFKTVSACQLTGTNYENDNDKLELAINEKEKKEVLPPVKVLGKEELELARQNEMKERERQKHLLAMEGEEEEEEEEREGQGKKEKKGNLERLNQDNIPHSTSSFFDAVVSDIPSLTEEKEEKGKVKEVETGVKKKVEPLHVYELVQQDEGYEFMQPRPPPTPARSATFSSGGSVSPPVSPSTVSSSPPLSPTSLSPPLSPTGGPGARSDGRQIMLKLHMHTVHPGVMYKMFRVSDSTTVLDLVSMALKKANLIEDSHSYAIYNIQTSNKVIAQSIKDGDYVLPYLGKTREGTQWELRRKKDSKKVEIIIDVNGASKKSMSLLMSPQTSSQEVTLLLSRKLGLTIPKGKENPYRILLVHDDSTDERMVGSDSPLLYSRSSSTSSSSSSSTDRFKMVDIVHYLTKEGDPSSSTEAAAPKPKDFESAKIILQQSHERLLELQKELVVKGYTIKQTEMNFEETRKQNDTLQAQMDTLQSDIKTYQEKNKVLTQTVEELHETLSVLTSKNKELTNSVSVLSKENDKMKEEHQKDELTIAKLHQAMNETSRVSKEEKEGLKYDHTLLEEERDRLLKQIKEYQTQPHGKAIPNTNSSRSVYSLLNGRVQNLLVSIQLKRSPDEGLGIMLTNNPSGSGCIIKNVTESSQAHGTLLTGDRLLEVNGEDVSNSNHKDILKVLERQLNDGTVQLVVCRDNLEGEEARDGDSGGDIEQLKEECSRLKAQLSEAHSLLNENELLLQEREEQIERTKSQLLPSKDIDNLKKQILENQLSTDKSESLADTLKDASQEELLDALRTVEADCLRNKESLDRLFALIVGHTPELLSVMAEVQPPEGDDHEDGSEFDDEDINTSSPVSPSPPPPTKTGGWC